MELIQKNDPVYVNLSSGTEGHFLAIQNKKVLGVFASYDEAVNRCNEEIQKDRFYLLSKRFLLSKLIKKLRSDDYITDYYVVAEVKNYEVPKLF